jgi:hypothetical protein
MICRTFNRFVSMRKYIFITAIIGCLTVINCFTDQPATTSDAQRPLVEKHDTNGNGKIDAEEHRVFARERAKRHIADVKDLAKHRPKLGRQERMFYQLPSVTPDLVRRYDVNGNGKLDLNEKIKVQADAGEKAKAEFRSHDKNGDGKLSAAELKGVKIRIPGRATAAASGSEKADEPGK